jgi:hypothetical protein
MLGASDRPTDPEQAQEPTMTISMNPTFRRTARLGACFLMGAAVLTACGDDAQVATAPGVASSPPAVTPGAAYVSPEQADREALLAVRAAHASADSISRRPAKYVSPEQADKAAMLELRARRASADALERRAAQASVDTVDRSADLDAASALARVAAVEQSSAHASADSIERRASVEQTSAHRSVDALEHWALSDDES